MAGRNLTSMRAITIQATKRFFWLAAILLGAAGLAAEESPEIAAHIPAVSAALKPAPANRKDLPAVFTQKTPASIADLRQLEQYVEKLIPRVSPAVVAVEVGYTSGSGVVISADGLVLTAGHVCGEPGREVRFTFSDGKQARGKTIGADSDSDTGLMRITSGANWPHVPVGDLTQARLGDWVLALGNPGGFDPRRSLVTRLGRIIRLAPAVLQTDCTISPGDSGGPLFDMHGRVIGIHTAISSSLAENFHVPITEYADTWQELVKAETRRQEEEARQAFVGARTADDSTGCRFSTVDPDGPAAKAGLKVGDLILKVDGRDIKASAAFRRWVTEAQPGETLNLQVRRGNQLLTMPLKPEFGPTRN